MRGRERKRVGERHREGKGMQERKWREGELYRGRGRERAKERWERGKETEREIGIEE